MNFTKTVIKSSSVIFPIYIASHSLFSVRIRPFSLVVHCLCLCLEKDIEDIYGTLNLWKMVEDGKI